MKKKIFCITLILVMVMGTISVNAKSKAKSEKINDYLETSFDVYNVQLIDSIYTLKDMVSDGLISPCIDDALSSIVSYTISAKKNGCIVLYRAQSPYIEIKDIKTKNIKKIFQYEQNYGREDILLLPMRKGDKISISKLSNNSGTLKAYLGFIPEEKIFHIDDSVKNSNGTLTFTFGNIFKNDTDMSVTATKKTYTSAEIMAQDLYLYNPTITYNYTSTKEGDDAVIVLPERGEYTIRVKLTMNNTILAFDTFILDTDKYIEPNLESLEEPISAVTGTNIIVGYAEPYNTVYVEYDGKKYEGTANRNGIYKIILKKDMKEGVAFKIWQSNDKGLTSKKAKYRVTDL